MLKFTGDLGLLPMLGLTAAAKAEISLHLLTQGTAPQRGRASIGLQGSRG